MLKDSGKSRYFINAFNALFFYLGLKSTISYFYQSNTAIGLTTLLIGALYLAIALTARKKYPETKNIYKQWVLTATVLLIFATNSFFTGFEKIIAWSLEAFGLVYIGSKYEHNYLWKFALWMYGFIVLMLISTKGAIDYTPIDSFVPVLNLRVFAFVTLALSMIGSSLFLDKDSKKGIKPVFDYAWTIITFILLTSEINDYFRQQLNLAGDNTQQVINFHQNIMYIFVWALYALPLIWLGLKKKISAFKICGFGVLIFALLQLLVIGTSYIPIENFIFFFNFRMIAFIALITALLLVIKWLKEEDSNYTFIKTVQVIISLLVLYVLTIESSDIFNKQLYLQN